MEIPLSRAYEPLRRSFTEFPYETNPGAIITRIHEASGLAKRLPEFVENGDYTRLIASFPLPVHASFCQLRQ
jgi:hypothetical protein